jgi:NAD(P)-dependent dehydrogenase (short-subunit alcohol dehydrogenase family)
MFGRKLKDKVVVVTGASSGIGRATALAFARRRSSLVLASRRGEALETLTRECERLGGRAIAVQTDVSNDSAVASLAAQAMAVFGRVDVWVNNAAVSSFGRIDETPPDVYRQVIETNLLGYAAGAREAIRIFRQQGRGVLINVSSGTARLPQPYTSAYAASKAAVRQLGRCLRQELRDARHIHVCTVMPASIDTPLFQNAANYTWRMAKPMEPVHAAETVAERIVKLATKPRREVFVATRERIMLLVDWLSGGLGERLMARAVERDHFFPDQSEAPSDGNVFEPHGLLSSSGGWRRPGRSFARRVARLFALAGTAALVAPLVSRALEERREARGRAAPAGRPRLLGRRAFAA